MPAEPAFSFLRDFALILGTAGLATVLFQRLRLPVIVGYLVAGILVRPLIQSPDTIRTLAELGVVLLLFSIGLEFRFRRLASLGPRVGLAMAIEVGCMLLLGYAAGRLLGLPARLGFVAAGIVAISSTMIAAGTMADIRADRRLRDIVLGVTVMEDLAAVLLIVGLTTLAAGDPLTGTQLTGTLARLALFLVLFLIAGMLVVPRAVAFVVSFRRSETTLIVALGIALGSALLSYLAGFSVALGGFLAGALVAESGRHHIVAETVQPVRDLFTAVFFVAAGMLFDPAAMARQDWIAVALLALVVLAGKTAGVALGVFLAGYGVRDAIRAGLTLAQIGEFSFVIAGLAAARGAAPAGPLFPVAVAVATITAFVAPLLARRADPIASWVDRKLPHPIQNLVSLYGSWVELLVRRPPVPAPRARRNRLIGFLLLDAAAVTAAIIVTSVVYRRLPVWFGASAGRSPMARLAVLAAGALIALPFAIGLVRTMHRMAVQLAESAIPRPAKGVDQGFAPRQALAATLRIGLVIAVGIPLTLLTLPFVPPFGLLGVIAAYLLVLGVAFWRTARNLEQHTRAGAELVVHVLSKQARAEDTSRFGVVRELLPGLGAIVPLRVEEGSPAVGKTLGELNLRGRTGASVVAVSRDNERNPAPAAGTRLASGDLVAVTGTEQAIDLAAALLRATGTSSPPSDTGASAPPGG
jgi:CPA2 family monovalent cation:H+ antiporter-2